MTACERQGDRAVVVCQVTTRNGDVVHRGRHRTHITDRAGGARDTEICGIDVGHRLIEGHPIHQAVGVGGAGRWGLANDGSDFGGHVVHHGHRHCLVVGQRAGTVVGGSHVDVVGARSQCTGIVGSESAAANVEAGIARVVAAVTCHQAVSVGLAGVDIGGGECAHRGVSAAALVDGCGRERDVGGGVVDACDVDSECGVAGGRSGIAVGGGNREGVAWGAAGQGVDGAGVGDKDVFSLVCPGADDIQRAIGACF